jgi:hypothetical protein
VASRGIDSALFGLYWPPYYGLAHARDVAQTPFCIAPVLTGLGSSY